MVGGEHLAGHQSSAGRTTPPRSVQALGVRLPHERHGVAALQRQERRAGRFAEGNDVHEHIGVARMHAYLGRHERLAGLGRPSFLEGWPSSLPDIASIMSGSRGEGSEGRCLVPRIANGGDSSLLRGVTTGVISPRWVAFSSLLGFFRLPRCQRCLQRETRPGRHLAGRLHTSPGAL